MFQKTDFFPVSPETVVGATFSQMVLPGTFSQMVLPGTIASWSHDRDAFRNQRQRSLPQLQR